MQEGVTQELNFFGCVLLINESTDKNNQIILLIFKCQDSTHFTEELIQMLSDPGMECTRYIISGVFRTHGETDEIKQAEISIVCVW